ncbi:MAG TPA: UDP-2,3-diacylglucosamine diphosphatase [Chthoniobacteraceae bacterium]|jgi:UDP-2,3-diacylglucosamine pyrophosphatase LpxH|nr:UDP-2,3-diacylglucosamine diphosphatase [Chthoniobacteraceae bacterium]
MRFLRTGWISDIHLGTRGAQAEAVLDFLREHEFETLYVVGDLIDIWSLKRSRYWPQSHNDVIQKLLRAGRKGTRIVYIPGNHDEFIADFVGDFGAVHVVPRDIHTTADGRRLLVIHGHELDTVVQNIKWLAVAGDIGYQLLLHMNAPINWMRRVCGFGYWSLSSYVKQRVKNAVNFIGDFEKAIVRYASDDKVQGVLCGHIHSPAIRDIGGVTYYNCGDWVESCSALVEDFDGKIELITMGPGSLSLAAPQARALPSEADHALVAAKEPALKDG